MQKIYWIEDRKVAGRSFPSLEDLKKLYMDGGFRTLVSFEKREDVTEVEKIGYKVFSIFIKDFTSPTIEQIEKFNSIVESSKERPVLAHCLGGVGRTGTMLAGYLIKNKSMSAEQAIAEVRKQTDGRAVETPEQENTLKEYEKIIRISGQR